MAILLQRVSASSIEWVVIIIVDFFWFRETLCITPHINLLASGSIPVDGSSNNIIGVLHIKAMATDNFLLFPPDKVPATLFLNGNKQKNGPRIILPNKMFS